MITCDPIDFVTNDFLGFARSSTLCYEVSRRYHVYCQEFPNEKLGMCGSRLMVGTSQILEDLEHKIAEFHGAASAFFAGSGYIANLGLCYHLSLSSDILLWDEEIHMSVQKSLCVISGQHESFRHNDLNHLEQLLQTYRASSSGRIFIFICSVYSFTGSLAPLSEIMGLASKYNAHLVVDEAHAIGIFGNQGRGLCHQWGYEHFYAVLVTYGKAMGAMGAALMTSPEVKKDLMHNSPPLRYSTLVSPHTLITVGVAYDFLESEGKKARQQVFNLQKYFAAHYPAQALGCVQPIFIGTHLNNAIATLEAANLNVGVVAFFTPPFLRVNLHAYNTIDEVNCLIQILNRYLEKGCDRVYVDHEFHFWRKLCKK
nr:aminotransferase class I/II-fold pyridoxal phosphate-dependent enzyme [Candidatus Chlamydia sanziniae]